MRLICFILGHNPERILARLCNHPYFRDCGEYEYICCRCDRVVGRSIEKLEALEAAE